MSSLEENTKPYSKIIVKLLKAPIERNSNLWDDLILYQSQIKEYIILIGLELIVKKDEGFAFVKQIEDSEGNTLGLISRRPIGFEVSIVLVVLRQILEEFDSNPVQFEVTEKFVTDSEIKEEVELFLQEGYNRLKFQKDLDKFIRTASELGYLKEIGRKDNEVKYQIHRIIKEKITLDILEDFKLKLQEYVESV